ncbi:MAG: alpha/beta fold hydrolase [Promethearchaeota archaeon]
MFEEGEVAFDKKRTLYSVWWLPDSDSGPEGVLVGIHGLGAHAEREFHYMGPFMAENGWAMHAIDLPGFGHWTGLKGNVKNWSLLRRAVQIALDSAHQRFPDLPVFLMGISLGGLTILEYGLKVQKPRPVPIEGFITYVPAIDYNVDIKWYEMLAVAIVGSIAGNYKYYREDLDVVECHDPDSIAFQEDPLQLKYQRLGFLLKIWSKMRWVRKNARKWSDSLLIVAAEEDSLVKTSALEEWMEKVKIVNEGKDLVFDYRLFENTYHGVCHELRRNEIFETTLAFMKKILKK